MFKFFRGMMKFGGFDVAHVFKPIPKEEYIELIKSKYIIIGEQSSTVAFKFQDGPIKEVGVNGCQIDTAFETMLHVLKCFQELNPCRENAIAITKFQEGLMWLEQRKKDRVERDVEGTSNG